MAATEFKVMQSVPTLLCASQLDQSLSETISIHYSYVFHHTVLYTPAAGSCIYNAYKLKLIYPLFPASANTAADNFVVCVHLYMSC